MQLGLAGRGGQRANGVVDAPLLGAALLAAEVGGGRLVLTDLHHDEPRAAPRRVHLGDLGGELLADLLRELLAIEESRGGRGIAHRGPPGAPGIGAGRESPTTRRGRRVSSDVGVSGRDWMRAPSGPSASSAGRLVWIVGVGCTLIWFFAAVGAGSRPGHGAAKITDTLERGLMLRTGSVTSPREAVDPFGFPDPARRSAATPLPPSGPWTFLTWPLLHSPYAMGQLVAGLLAFLVFVRRFERMAGFGGASVRLLIATPILGFGFTGVSSLMGEPGFLGGVLPLGFLMMGYCGAADPIRGFLLFGHIPWPLWRGILVVGASLPLAGLRRSPVAGRPGHLPARAWTRCGLGMVVRRGVLRVCTRARLGSREATGPAGGEAAGAPRQ